MLEAHLSWCDSLWFESLLAALNPIHRNIACSNPDFTRHSLQVSSRHTRPTLQLSYLSPPCFFFSILILHLVQYQQRDRVLLRVLCLSFCLGRFLRSNDSLIFLNLSKTSIAAACLQTVSIDFSCRTRCAVYHFSPKQFHSTSFSLDSLTREHRLSVYSYYRSQLYTDAMENLRFRPKARRSFVNKCFWNSQDPPPVENSSPRFLFQVEVRFINVFSNLLSSACSHYYYQVYHCAHKKPIAIVQQSVLYGLYSCSF